MQKYLIFHFYEMSLNKANYTKQFPKETVRVTIYQTRITKTQEPSKDIKRPISLPLPSPPPPPKKKGEKIMKTQ